jgi:DNA-binding MarR family transcriptional regulator
MNMAVDDLLGLDEIELGDLSQSLGFLLRIAQVQIFRAYFRRLGKHDLMPAEFSILWVLHLNEGVRQGAIAQGLSIKPAHMTKLIQKLVTTGYVTRNVPEDDRRSVRLALTEAGRTLITSHQDEFLNLHQYAPGHLNQSELAALVALLRKYTGLGSLS